MTSQYSRVLTILSTAGKPLALFEIRAAILKRFRHTDSEAAISARIRAIRQKLEIDAVGTVAAERQTGVAWFRYLLKSNACMSNAVVTSA